jgi:hypothetical protein
MKLKKSDFQITYETEGCYRLLVREKFFWIFKRWVFVTTQEAEHSDETPLEFKTFKEATDFVDLIAE